MVALGALTPVVRCCSSFRCSPCGFVCVLCAPAPTCFKTHRQRSSSASEHPAHLQPVPWHHHGYGYAIPRTCQTTRAAVPLLDSQGDSRAVRARPSAPPYLLAFESPSSPPEKVCRWRRHTSGARRTFLADATSRTRRSARVRCALAVPESKVARARDDCAQGLIRRGHD